MGAAVSTNIAKQVTNDTVNIMNTAGQCCYTANEQISFIGGYNWGGGPVTISHIDQSDISVVNASCQQNVTFSTSTSTSISQSANQVATAITQALGMGVSASTELINSVESVMTSVVNSVQGTCLTTSLQDQTIIGENAGGTGPVLINYIDQGAQWDAMTSCVQNDTTVTHAQANLVNQISQHAEAQVEGIFGNLGFLLIIILVIVGGILLLGFRALTNPVFLVVLVVIIGLWLGLAYWRKWWPFK